MRITNSNIAFTGVKNVGGEHNTFYGAKIRPDGTRVQDSTRSVDSYVVSMELTDDYTGKDLTNFKREVMKADIENGYHDFNINFMHLHILKPNDKNDGKFGIYLNDSEVEIKDENLSLLSFIAAALKKVGKTPEDKLVLNKSFLEDSYEASIMLNSLCLKYPEGVPSREDLTDDDNQQIQTFYDKRNAKEVCNNALDAITDKMLDYFS